MTRFLTILLAFSLTGCMAMVFGTADQLNQLSIGMPKSDVLKLLGPPKSVSASGDTEYMQYSWVKTVIAADANRPGDYYVAIQSGKVSSFGRKGDFDSTKPPTQRIEIDQTVRQSSSTKETKDLYTELKKLKDLKDSGVITDSEFESQKKKLLATQ
ncbi:Short C-terminal domain-containing protein [Collimonas sp. OK607]|uniref:SHOCT domain-containing protein n=1 Tax=Collimonas sp. OK607 TaxID=1798194 RepID=UPI0008E31A75|nr:SHOCT domain-containing protein [Collimonas sp. OK607]SFA84899.1 Short C-terminal domain-containing protein [Collimonas sp. OK607]